MDQLLRVKTKGLGIALLFVSLFCIPSICDAVDACVDGTPLLNVVAPYPKAPGGTVTYSATATGNGFATYEVRASDAGLLQSGAYTSGQSVSGSYATPTGAGLLTFIIKDAGGKEVTNCYAEADLTYAQEDCTEQMRNEACYYHGSDDFEIRSWEYEWGETTWGSPNYYHSCFKCAEPAPKTYSYKVETSQGVINTGAINEKQMLVGFYNNPYNAESEWFSLTWPGADHWLDGELYELWAITPPECDASFSTAGALTAGNNVQFDASAANLDGNRPYNYKWKVDGADYLQGGDKNVVYDSFLAGAHQISLTVDDGLGTSCSSSKSITIATPPTPGCVADFTAPASAYYDQDVSFDPGRSSDTGEANVVYTWYKSDGTLLGTTNSVAPFKYAFDSSTATPVGVKLHVVHNLTGAVCDSPVHTINLLESPGGECLPNGTSDRNDYAYSRDVSSSGVQTHRLIWEPGKVTYDSFEGTGTGGNNYFHTVITKDVPVPTLRPGYQEWVKFGIFPYSAAVAASGKVNDATADDRDVRAATVVLRNFSFTPAAGYASAPSASRESLDGKYGGAGETIDWKGYTWGLRDGGSKGNPGFGKWSKSNISGPDANGHLTLRLTNSGSDPVGAQLSLLKAGLGYGTYTVVVSGDMKRLDKNAAFGGMQLFFPNWNDRTSASACAEFRADETSAWGAGTNVQLLHRNSWYGCAGPSGICPIAPLEPEVPPTPCTVDLEAKDINSFSCLTGGCHFNSPIIFTAIPKSGSIVSYDWTIDNTGGIREVFDGNINTGATVSKIFLLSDGKSHTVRVTAHDSNGTTCTASETIGIKAELPGWDEIAPYLMLTGPIGFVLMMLVARIILL